jgi:hypothetical protein
VINIPYNAVAFDKFDKVCFWGSQEAIFSSIKTFHIELINGSQGELHYRVAEV